MFTRLPKNLTNGIYRLRMYRTSSFAAAVVFLVSLFISGAIGWKTEQNRTAQERDRLYRLAEEYTANIQRDLESALSVTYTVSALVHEYQGTVPNFDTVAQDLLSLYPGADTLALLPNDTVAEFASLQNGKKLLSRNQVKKLAPQTINLSDSQELILVIPNSSATDFVSVVGYLPIFLSSPQEKSNFWGFVSVTVRFAELLNNLNLKSLEDDGYAYQLSCRHPDQDRVVDASLISINDSPIEKIINVANTDWTLSIAPATGWNRSYKLWLKFLLAVFLSIILASGVKLFLDSRASSLESESLAYFDSLTSLPNRRLLLYHLERVIARTKRTGKNTAICHLNLDNFKAINIRLGRKTGDYTLVRIAKRLQKFLRTEDVIARVDGDNFVIVLQELSNVAEAELVIKRIIKAIISPITINSEVIHVSASIGVVIYPIHEVSEETLLAYANQAMSYTKQNQKGSYTLFHNLKTIIQ